MKTRVAINGFGRIGRICLRALLQNHKDQLSVVAINDLGSSDLNAHLFQYDSNYGTHNGTVEATDGSLRIDEVEIAVLSEAEPASIPWHRHGVDIVIEATGRFTDAIQAKGHLEAGARKVIITAPAKNPDITVVLGVNESAYDPKRHHVVSNASCTTNCLAPVVRTLHESLGIETGLMTTTHAYTSDQRIVDLLHSDLRRARAAGTNIVPTTTGAAQAIGLVIPELSGKLHGLALRVPTATVSVVDFVAYLKVSTTAEEVNEALKERSEGLLKGILAYCEKPLVSSDFRGHSASAIIDAPSTTVMGGRLAKVLAWYDNEWGYSCRVADLASFIATQDSIGTKDKRPEYVSMDGTDVTLPM